MDNKDIDWPNITLKINETLIRTYPICKKKKINGEYPNGVVNSKRTQLRNTWG